MLSEKWGMRLTQVAATYRYRGWPNHGCPFVTSLHRAANGQQRVPLTRRTSRGHTVTFRPHGWCLLRRSVAERSATSRVRVRGGALGPCLSLALSRQSHRRPECLDEPRLTFYLPHDGGALARPRFPPRPFLPLRSNTARANRRLCPVHLRIECSQALDTSLLRGRQSLYRAPDAPSVLLRELLDVGL